MKLSQSLLLSRTSASFQKSASLQNLCTQCFYLFRPDTNLQLPSLGRAHRGKKGKPIFLRPGFKSLRGRKLPTLGDEISASSALILSQIHCHTQQELWISCVYVGATVYQGQGAQRKSSSMMTRAPVSATPLLCPPHLLWLSPSAKDCPVFTTAICLSGKHLYFCSVCLGRTSLVLGFMWELLCLQNAP